MKYLTIVLLFVLLFTSVTTSISCTEKTANQSIVTNKYARVKDLTVQEAYALINRNLGNSNFIILDVRTLEEYSTGHLQNALNLDVNSGKFEQEVNKLDKNKVYLVYCRSGVRSKKAADIMLNTGFKEIYNMTGGILEWQAEGYSVVN